MHLLIYAGPGPSRDDVLATVTPLVERVATAVTLVTGGGARHASLLDEAAGRLGVAPGVPVTRRVLDGAPQAAILTVAGEQAYDLVVFGQFQRPLERFLRVRRDDALAVRLKSSVLRVKGPARPLQRILLASGGDKHTFTTAERAVQLAAPLGASITVLHVVSQQPIVFDPRALPAADETTFLAGDSPEAATLRQAAEWLRARGISAALRVRFGLVVDEILAELAAGDYDLLAVGTHHLEGPLDRMLIEDLTGDLLDLCPRSMLVARHAPGE